ncbi:MAG: DUF4349 domain-containing protein, partial [Oscillospiraceae bacterium]|nr:DUF4349 domain-containing protein [Oscillospiraceae bacterium]
ALILLLSLYILILVGRFIYDMVTYEDPAISDNYYYTGYDSYIKSTQNVASFRKEYVGTNVGNPEILEQKYEQVATITAKTVYFDDDLAKLDAAIENSQAVIQTEVAKGLVGKRTITRVIGVKPQYFNSCLEAVKDVGMLVSSTSQKTDKTYEYRQMLAQKQELEKRLDSYVSLREHSGSINERLKLEDSIIDVESMLLQQAVDLGEYSDDNALCTINVSLYEGDSTNIARVIWNSFVWTNKCFFSIIGLLLLLCVTIFVLAKTYIFLGNLLTGERKRKALIVEAGEGQDDVVKQIQE